MLIGNEPFVRFCKKDKILKYQGFVKKISLVYNIENFDSYYVKNLYDLVSVKELDFLEIYIFELLYQ